MDLHKRLQPIGPIHHGTHLFGIDNVAPARLCFCQIGTGGCIREAREIGKLTDMDVGQVLCSRRGRNFSNGQCPYFCPFSPSQRCHRSIRADHHTKVMLLIAAVFLPGKAGLGCLGFLNPFATLLAQPASCL
jgi:hypothetical protein